MADVSGIVPPETLYSSALNLFEREARKNEAETVEWLNGHGDRLIDNLYRWINAAIKTRSRAAVEAAVRDRSWVATCDVDLREIAVKILEKTNPRLRRTMPRDKLEYALIMLSEDGGYVVEDKKIKLSFELVSDDTSEDSTAPKALEPDFPNPDDDGADFVEPPAAPEVTTPPAEEAKGGLTVGHVYSNDKGMIREITSLENGSVGYRVLESSNARVAVGTEGEVALKSFASWAKKDLGPVTAEA